MKGKMTQMPYNQGSFNAEIDVSDDSLSDVPDYNWDVPDELSKPHVWQIAQMWIDYARQSIRLKGMVYGLVLRELHKKNECENCHQQFRLQVIQKYDFNYLTMRFRQETLGIPFNRENWRTFFKQN
jgi:hypothetical protein